jgi:hypothetical protein
MAKSNKLGIASLVLGILSILFSAVLPIALILGILAIIFGIKRRKSNVAIAGIITGALGIVFSILLVMAVISLAILAYSGNPKLI